MTFCCSYPLSSQNTAVVWGDYIATTYMDTLNGKKIIFPEYFIDSIQRFGITQYYQSFPFSKISSLKSNITFECPIENAEIFANFLQIQSSSLFSNIGFEIPSTARFNYDPTDDFWNEQKQITTHNGQETIDNLWHLKIIKADSAWNITKGNPNIKIAIIDSNFYCTHPDLIGKINFFDPFDQTFICSNNINVESHGTKVACVAAGNTDENNGRLSSVGFNCGIVAYNSGTSIDIWVEKAYDAAINQKVKVINFSLKGKGHPSIPTNIKQRWRDAIKEILDSGTVIVRSAGNNVLEDGLFNRLPFSSVIDDRIIIVSATNSLDSHINPSSFANSIPSTYCHYPEVTICAPGYDITTGDFYYSGTYPYINYFPTYH